ncbi:abortive infection system Abi protein [Streptococcus varani]|uniref:Abortive infection system Abi protein n=1 Tax=Streptococcus varani TaxID=1608583 RepID=A0A0E4H7J7_9STRE|nr:abortive infection system Abi protein [Streptococcus varani]
MENIRQTVPLDIATGDPITPKSISYAYKSIFFERQYTILSYNVETILAEKLETIYRRGFLNTRSKDFYDVYILGKTRGDSLDFSKLQNACVNTFAYRGTDLDIADFRELLSEMVERPEMKSNWIKYQEHYDYAKEISFDEVIIVCDKVLETLENR